MTGKGILLIAAAMFLLALLVGCGDSGVESQAPAVSYSQSACYTPEGQLSRSTGLTYQDPFIVDVTQSECLNHLARPAAAEYDVGGTVHFAVSYDTVFVYHDTAYYNCCVGFSYTVERNGAFLDFLEADTGMQCDCMCYFDLQTSAAGVSPGLYTVRLWTENRAELLGQAELVVTGVDAIWFETNCDTLTVHHNAKSANCGALYIFDVTQEGSILTFTERDTSQAWMHCMCYFDLTAQMTGLANGEYTVRLWDDGNTHDMGGEVDSLITEATVIISCP